MKYRQYTGLGIGFIALLKSTIIVINNIDCQMLPTLLIPTIIFVFHDNKYLIRLIRIY